MDNHHTYSLVVVAALLAGCATPSPRYVPESLELETGRRIEVERDYRPSYRCEDGRPVIVESVGRLGRAEVWCPATR